MRVIGFDVFGTLVDPDGIAEAIRPLAGDRTAALLAEWRRTQLEYAFRRAAMGRYMPFDRVTGDALERAAVVCGVDVPAAEREALVAAWTALPAYAEAAPALDALRAAGHRCLACSNGTPAGLERLLEGTGLAARLDGVISVEEVRTYKPAPAVYEHLVATGGAGPGDTWLVSGNPWDVIGARAAGLRAAWIRRSPGTPFDTWEEEPDIVAHDLTELAARPGFAGDTA